MHPFITLLWKEWREQRWKLAAFTAMALAVPAITWVRDPGFAVETTYFILGAYAVVGGLFLGMGVAAGERAAGTERFTEALPISRRVAMAAKILAAALAAATPAVAVIALAWLGAALRLDAMQLEPPTGLELLIALTAGISAVVQVLLWTVLAGMRRPTELSAGVAGAAVLLAGVFLLAVAATFGEVAFGYERYVVMWPVVGIVLVSPAGLAMWATESLGPWWVAFPAQVLVVAGLASAVVWRAGVVRHVGGSMRGGAEAPPSLGGARLKPWRTTAGALTWKAGREAAPIAMLGLVVLALLVAWTGIDTDSARANWGDKWLSQLTQDIAIPIGVTLALVLGVGMFVPDLRPGVAHFWRSRPITVGGWYWSHWLVGAGVLLLCVAGPAAVVAAITGDTILADPYFWTVPLLQAATFGIAVTIACAVRQPIYAGALAFGLAMLPWVLPGVEPTLEWFSIQRAMQALGREGWSNWAYLRWLGVCVALGLVTIAGGRWAAEAKG